MHQRAVREFYFNARYLMKRILSLRSMDDARIQLRQGCGLWKNYVRRRSSRLGEAI
jgi:hypothetical protein